MARRRVSIVPHTHWDREWYQPFQTFRLRLVDLLDELLPALDADLDYVHYLLDGQMAVVDDYLEVRPEAAETLRRLISSGRVDVGPWYTLPDEFCVSGETLIRNLQLGFNRAAAFGGAMPVGYLPDMFGHVAQMPQLLRLFGLDQAVVWRGVPSAVDRTAFWWSAPDGSTVRAEYLWHGYGNGAHLVRDPVAVHKRVHATLDAVGPALAGELLFMNGTDHQRPQAWLAQAVREANEISDDLELTVTSLPEALARSRQTLGDGERNLPRWQGELRSSARSNLLMGVASNRLDVHQAAARAERVLERLAEPLSALWLPPGQWPGRPLEIAWLAVIRNAAHDSSCACSADAVGTAVLHRYDEAAQIGEGLTARALARLAEAQARPGAIIVNPSARLRSGLVELTVPGEGAVEGGQLIENRPTVIIDRIMSPGDTWSWMLGFRSQRIDEGTYVNAVEIGETEDTIELTLRCEDHLGENLLIDDVKAELNTRLAARPGTPLHLRIVQAPTRRILWHVEDVAGFGWLRWAARRPAATAVTASATRMSNDLVTVAVDPATATFSLNGTGGFGRLMDSGDHGDTYNFSPPDHDVIIDRPESVALELLEDGPLRARLRMRAKYQWPERIDDDLRARVGSIATVVDTTIELRTGEPFVRVRHAWDNRCRDHRVRAILPLPSPTTSSSGECAFAVVNRGLHAEGGPTERPLATTFSRRFVRAGDVTVVHDGLLEYELTDAAGRSLAGTASEASALSMTLLRATGMLSRVEMTYRPLPAGPPLVVNDAQRLGPVEASYAVCVDATVNPYALADAVLVPLQVAVGPGGGDAGSDGGQALSIEGAEVSAVVREAGQLVVRVFNPTDRRTTARFARRSGWLVDLRGRPVSAFNETVALDPWQIVTVHLAEP